MAPAWRGSREEVHIGAYHVLMSVFRIPLSTPIVACALVLVFLAPSPIAWADTDFNQFLDAAYRKHYDFEASLEVLRSHDREALSPEDRLSYDLFEWYLEDQALVRSVVMGEVAKSDVPYERWLGHYTTTSLLPSELYEILSSEVRDNRAEVDRLFSVLAIEGDSMTERMAVVAQIGLQKTAEMGRAVSDEMQEYVDTAAVMMKPHFALYPIDPVIVTPVPGLLSVAGFRKGSEAQGRPNQVQILPGRDGVPYYLRLTIAHHEAFPGHYVQEYIQGQLTGLPQFRSQGGFPAYTEAWALYAEHLAQDVGLFEERDPLFELGIAESKLWRSSKALTDVGLNGMGWSLDKAHTFLSEALDVDESEAHAMVGPMIENPGAATASYTGYICYVSFRERMEAALGDAFRLVDYHCVVLENGPMPMKILERVIDDYIATHTAG